MHRTQILIEDSQYRALKDEALATGRSLADIVRGCIDEHLKRVGDDPLLGLVGAVKAEDDPAPVDLAEHHDRYLYS